ncbi:MAG TPA: acyltransferase [Methylocella sp.]|nr:acyltransferase [Methylocella sp.]
MVFLSIIISKNQFAAYACSNEPLAPHYRYPHYRSGGVADDWCKANTVSRRPARCCCARSSLYHFNIFFLPQAKIPYINRAYLAVDFFFLLSGFVMASVYGRLLADTWRAHWRRFAIARFARIYPLFILTTLIIVTLVMLSGMPMGQVSFSKNSLALQPALLQQWASGLNWNYPSWSISTEAEAYAFFVFSAGTLVEGPRPSLISMSCIASLAALSVINGGSLDLFHGLPALIRTIAEFSLGVLLYRAHLVHPQFLNGRALSLAVIAAVLATLTRIDFIFVIAFACAISHIIRNSDMIGRLLNSRIPTALGNWSYSIYLWHVPVHYTITTAIISSGCSLGDLGKWKARLLICLTVFGVIGLSAASYRYFEVPMRHLILRATAHLSKGRAAG